MTSPARSDAKIATAPLFTTSGKNKMTKTPTNWTRRDDAAVEDMIRRGASRRELLKMLMASGVAVAAGGSVLMNATAAALMDGRNGANQ